MTIYCEFNRVWTFSEVEDFIRDPAAEKYNEMDNGEKLELSACADCYTREKRNFNTEEEMNQAAMENIALDIEYYFSKYLYQFYYDDNINRIKINEYFKVVLDAMRKHLTFDREA